MNERTTLEKIAPTVAEAVAEGLAELGLTQEAVDVEVLDGGSRGLFGMGGRQARVRLTLKAVSSAPAAGAPVSAAAVGEQDEFQRVTRQVVTELLEKMKARARLTLVYGEPNEEGTRPLLVDMAGEDLTVLIGRRAEILNSMQHIVNLIVSKQVEHWVQIQLDVEGYRARREQQLRQMARRMADQAIKTGRRQVLEPMTAAERRVVHLELREHPNVATQSIGEEPTRKVSIVPK